MPGPYLSDPADPKVSITQRLVLFFNPVCQSDLQLLTSAQAKQS